MVEWPSKLTLSRIHKLYQKKVTFTFEQNEFFKVKPIF